MAIQTQKIRELNTVSEVPSGSKLLLTPDNGLYARATVPSIVGSVMETGDFNINSTTNKVELKERTFTGTTAEWNALTVAEKAKYLIVNLTDDSSGGGGNNNAEIADIVNVYGAKNLIPYPCNSGSRTNNGITFTDNGDGTVTANGTATADVSYNISQRYGVSGGLFSLKNGNYLLSGCEGGSNTTFFIQAGVTKNNVFSLLNKNYDGDTAITVDGDDNSNDSANIAVQIVVRSGQTLTNKVFKPMIRLASIQDNTWVPYAKTNKKLTDDNNELQTVLTSKADKSTLMVVDPTAGSGLITFGVDANGNYGYKKVGADTVTPFKSGDNKVKSFSCAGISNSGSSTTNLREFMLSDKNTYIKLWANSAKERITLYTYDNDGNKTIVYDNVELTRAENLNILNQYAPECFEFELGNGSNYFVISLKIIKSFKYGTSQSGNLNQYCLSDDLINTANVGNYLGNYSSGWWYISTGEPSLQFNSSTPYVGFVFNYLPL